MRDLISDHIVINALRAVDGISCPPPGGSRGNLDYVRLQREGRTLAQAIARPLTGARPHYVRLHLRGAVDARRLPVEAVDGLQITDSGEVIVEEENIAQGVRLIEYLRDAQAVPAMLSDEQARSTRKSSSPTTQSRSRGVRDRVPNPVGDGSVARNQAMPVPADQPAHTFEVWFT